MTQSLPTWSLRVRLCTLLALASPGALVALEAALLTQDLARIARSHLAKPSGVDTCNWVIAPLYDGLLRAGFATGDAGMIAPVLEWGHRSGWQPGLRTYHADDHAVGHAWLDLYLLDKRRSERLEPFQRRFEAILAKPVQARLDFRENPSTPAVEVTDRWSWCDALYMAPPTLARLTLATGDARYLAFMDQEFRYAYEHLYDKQAQLFYRDGRYLQSRSPNGKRVFWSRGNGWVYAGLALVLEALPKDSPSRPFYEDLFKEMTQAVLRTQQPDGFWYPNLDDAQAIPTGEASGTAFFAFGLAWGLGQELLDRETHWPAIEKAWKALQRCVREDGRIGYVQPIGFAPDQFGPDTVQDYGTGAVLLAGAEILRCLGAVSRLAPEEVLRQAEAQVAAKPVAPRAYGRWVPERKDDFAWENDRVAFRIYGPALREAPEDSGIDVWTKKVPFPVIDLWYHRELKEGLSYHTDRGEGLDAYKVAGSRGCGGLGLWVDGKLVSSDTFLATKLHWTAEDRVEFTTVYRYPLEHKGKPVYEHRHTRLRLGERLAEVSLYFSSELSRVPPVLMDFDPEVAIGLLLQTKEGELLSGVLPRTLVVYEAHGEGSLGTAVLVEGTQPVRYGFERLEGGQGRQGQGLVLTHLDAQGQLQYRFGFAWSAEGEIKTKEAWVAYLAERLASGRR